MRALLVVMLVLATLLAWLQYRLWFGVGGTEQVEELRSRVEAQARQNEGLEQRNAALAAEVADLKSGEAAIGTGRDRPARQRTGQLDHAGQG